MVVGIATKAINQGKQNCFCGEARRAAAASVDAVHVVMAAATASGHDPGVAVATVIVAGSVSWSASSDREIGFFWNEVT